MESMDDLKGGGISSKLGFFKHVFNFNDDSKVEILNIIQYALISIVPIVVLNKLSQKYVPEADEEKGSLEISVEIIIQILVIFLGILIINRIITYIPTYSGEKYPDFNVTYIILAFLMITLSLQTKLGEKVSIIVDRVSELWSGGDDDAPKDKKKKKKSGQGNVKISQPISQGQGQSHSQNNTMSPQMEQSLYSTPISQLPITASLGQQQGGGGDNYQQNSMDSGSMIMPANEMCGGSAFGSAFGGGF
jgi:hypothetical protein